MRIFSKLYQRVMVWSKHPHAIYYLLGLSFSEASFFPIPPDVMLVPMSISKPEKAIWYATLTTLFSIMGGIFGYFLGFLFLTSIHPLIVHFGYEQTFIQAQSWFHQWGFLALLIAGFSPIPYKIFTIAAGAMKMSFPLFVIASILGRGARFYLVSLLMRWGGVYIERVLYRFIDWIGWGCAVLLVAAYFIFHG